MSSTMIANSTDSIKLYKVWLSCIARGIIYNNYGPNIRVYMLAQTEEEARNKALYICNPYNFFSGLKLFLLDSDGDRYEDGNTDGDQVSTMAQTFNVSITQNQLDKFHSLMDELDSNFDALWKSNPSNIYADTDADADADVDADVDVDVVVDEDVDVKAMNNYIKSHHNYKELIKCFIPMMKCVEIELGTNIISEF